MTLRAWLETASKNPVWVGLAGVILGAFLNKFLPFLWSNLLNIITWLLGRFGGRLAHRHLEKRLMNWMVTQMRELKLTGIISSDDAKKPTLEQVFVSLRLAERHAQDAEADDLDEFLSKCSLPGTESPHQVERLMALLPRLQTLDADDLNTLEKLLREKMHSHDYRELLKGLPLGRQVPHLVWCASHRLRERLLLLKYRVQARYARARDGEPKSFILNRIRWMAFALIRAVQLNDSDLNAAYFKRILRHTPRLAILGGPGAGKTTLLQYVGLSYARARAGDSKLYRRALHRRQLGSTKWRVPIYVPLSTAAPLLSELNLQGHAPSLLQILPKLMDPELRREYEKIAADYFNRRVARGECVFLLDGLDEVPSDIDFGIVVTAVESLALRHPNNQFLVTSRIAGWRSGIEADFRKYYVNDLTDRQIETFVETWYAAVEQNAVIGALKEEGAAERNLRVRRAETKARELQSALQHNPSIRKLATNPMLLSIIAMVHRSLATLPRERAKLYHQCTRILLEQWDISRGVRVDDTGLKLEQKEAVMRRLAYAMHRGEIGDSGGAREAPRTDVERIIGSLLPGMGRSQDEAAQLLRRLMDRSGLIIERRRDVLGFAHLTFQEYFAAQSLTADQPRRAVSFLTEPGILFSDWWREVLLLYSGLQADSSALLETILKDMSDRADARLHLASLCFIESVQVKDESVRHTLEALLLQLRLNSIIEICDPLPGSVREYLTFWVGEQVEAGIASLSGSSNRYSLDEPEATHENEVLLSYRGLHDRLKHSRRFLRLNGEPVTEERLLQAIVSENWVVREAAASLFLELQPTNSAITAVVDLTADSDSDVRAAAVRTLKGWAKVDPESVFRIVDKLLESGETQVLLRGLHLVSALGDGAKNINRFERTMSLLRHPHQAVQSAAVNATRQTASGAQAARLLVKNVQGVPSLVPAALRVAASIDWEIDADERSKEDVVEAMSSGGRAYLIAAAILCRSGDTVLRRDAVRCLLEAKTSAGVRNDVLRAIAGARRGDLDDSLEAQLHRMVRTRRSWSREAAICLGRLSRCTSAEAVIDTFKDTVLSRRRLGDHPLFFRRRMLRTRMYPEVKVLREFMTLADPEGNDNLDWELSPFGRPAGLMAGLVAFGQGCGADHVTPVLLNVLARSGWGMRHVAALALCQLPLASVEEVYPQLVAFYTSDTQGGTVNWFMPDDSVPLIERHPLVLLASRLHYESLQRNTLKLLRHQSGFSKVCALTIIGQHEGEWSSEIYDVLADLLTAGRRPITATLLTVARALLAKKPHAALLEAVSKQLRSDQKGIREAAWEIVSSHYIHNERWKLVAPPRQL
jgi:hypothetical protein